MSTLWFDLDEMEDDEEDKEDGPNYEIEEYDDLYDQLADEPEEIICPVCKKIVEDGVQCGNCGYVIGV